MTRSVLIALTLLAAPAAAFAQSEPQTAVVQTTAAARPTAQPEVLLVTASRVVDTRLAPQHPLITDESPSAKAIAERIEMRPKEAWVSNEGMSFTGAKLGYRQRF